MDTLRYEEKIARRDHRRRCDLSGTKIEKGDRYFESVTVDGRDYIKGHAILGCIAQGISLFCPDEGWDPRCAIEYLASFIRYHLGTTEHWDEDRGWVESESVQACIDHARQYWAQNR